MSAVIRVEELRKSFRTPLRRRRVEVLRGVSFEVERGEVFGFLGPNGAGKTTTIRILMGLIAASDGRAFLFDQLVPSRAPRARLGFLPESPYFYDYLSVTEMLDLTGCLFNLDRATRRRRSEELIELVGLTHARNTPLKKYSKGMLQRAGIAQALINEPELVVLDEPTSGLDPVGRKEVREIIVSLRERGTTVFFSSHILADVEEVSDRIGIIVGGRMRDVGSVRELVGDRLLGTEVRLRLPAAVRPTDDDDDSGRADGSGEGAAAEGLIATLSEGASVARVERDLLVLELDADADVDAVLARAAGHGVRVYSVTPRHQSLEDLFLEHARPGGGQSDRDQGDRDQGDRDRADPDEEEAA
ncbi:ABC transporter ATP-binding protein [Haliangium sp.]|uniref:ABC transporter ATP-binding protein n=1 Tax=Haliangium sp. TaxID=2663208 RepID=UPI003D110F09